MMIYRYAPYIYFDKNEPFFPRYVGWTIFEHDSTSPSFDRYIEFYDDQIGRIIEYAIYWDFDIEHMYELEHVWVYVGRNGEVLDCESSFHGYYFRSLLRGGKNLEKGTHVRLFSQPGKHAFMPAEDYFDLLPRKMLYAPAWENAGSGGLMIPAFLKNSIYTNEKRNACIKAYLQKLRFVPSMEFIKYDLPEGIFLPWPELLKQIPRLLESKLNQIETSEETERG